jgi:N-acetylglucosamine-6-phosphate deacetylase
MDIQACHGLTGQSLKVTVQDGRIAAVDSATKDVSDTFIAPSFCDIQINGALGVAFTSKTLTTDGIRTVADECRRHGIGHFLPTVITSDFETIRASFAALSRAIDTDPALARAIPGFHLEGPYLSGDDGPRGAHPKEHARDPEWDEFQRWQDAAGGRIRMVTLAPERTGAITFIERLVSKGIVVAIGHTAADGDTIRKAIEAGARISTHLGNGCAGMLPRHDNPVWHQLASDDLLASVIADGHHLPPAVLKSILRGKTFDRLILTCDASPLAGLPPGRYAEWGSEFDVLPGGKIVVPGTPYLAGSGVFTDHCASHLLNTTDVTMGEVISMASVRPRRLMILPLPEVAIGTAMDDLIVFQWRRGEPIGMLNHPR